MMIIALKWVAFVNSGRTLSSLQTHLGTQSIGLFLGNDDLGNPTTRSWTESGSRLASRSLITSLIASYRRQARKGP